MEHRSSYPWLAEALGLGRRAFLLLALAALCAGGANLLRPSGHVVWIEDWSRFVEAKALKEGIPVADLVRAKSLVDAKSHLILDARLEEDFLAGHLPGARSLPAEFSPEQFEALQPYLHPGQPIMTYCSGADCDESFQLALFLRQQRFTNVVLYVGGFSLWQEAGYPVETGDTP